MADLASILTQIKRAKTNARVISAFTLGGAAAGIAIGIFANVDKLGAASVLLFLWGLVMLFGSLGAAENARFYVLLAKTPERIVWAYLKETRGMQSGDLKGRDIVLASDDGKTAEMPTSSKDEAMETIAFIEKIAPHARIGYDAAVAEQFKRAPASLRAS